MITLKQNPPAPIASITVSDRKVAEGAALGRPVVTGTIRVVDLHTQVVLEWWDDDVDQTLHDLATKTSFDVAGIDFEIYSHVDSDWLTVQAKENAETRHLKVKEFDYFSLVEAAMADNAAWSQRQPEARALEDHRRGI